MRAQEKDRDQNDRVTFNRADLFQLLEPHDRVAFEALIKDATGRSGAVSQFFSGDPCYVGDFRLLEYGQLELSKRPMDPIFAEIKSLVSNVRLHSGGAVTQNYLILCFGLPDWEGRLIAISLTAFDAFLKSEWPNEPLAPAEKRMLTQLLIGLSPRRAAQEDQISYETKRTYVKQLTNRLNVSGQVELVSSVLGRLLLAINQELSDPRENSSKALAKFKRECLPSSARVLNLLGPQDEVLRILHIGPQTGRPVLLAHPTILPFFGPQVSASLNRYNVRLVVPLRPGVLDPGAPALSPATYVERTIDGMAFSKHLLLDEDAPVLGISTGGSWAVRFAQKYPDQVPKLFLASMTFRNPRGLSPLGRFFTSLSVAVVRHPSLVSMYVDFALSRSRDAAKFRRMNERFFPLDTPDGDAMAWELEQHGALQAYMQFYQGSAPFLKSDTNPSFYAKTQDLLEIKCPIHLLHGYENTRDPISMIEDLVAATKNARLSTLLGAGHVLRGRNMDAIWEMIAESK